jgi:hypothetical protein
MTITGAMERRARRVRSQLARRAWEYRQRHHAGGVWFRLRRLLADASAAYAVPEEVARQLQTEGFPAEPVGAELEPPKVILSVPASRITRIDGARALPLRLGGELLGARYIALVRFPGSNGG